jgi:hypothetical protein
MTEPGSGDDAAMAESDAELTASDPAGGVHNPGRDTDVEPTPGETKRGAPDGATELTTDQEAQDPDSLVHPGNS